MIFCENEQMLNKLKKDIESLDQQHQIKIMEIFIKKNICFTENKNGIFINLNKIPEPILCEMVQYLEYINLQEASFNKLEKEKENLEKKYFIDE
jgi:hypothetical protein